MNEQWEKLSGKVAALEVRERVIILVAAVVVVLFIWAQVFYFPLEDRQKRASNSLRSISQQQSDLSQQLLVLEKKLSHDPNADLRTQQLELELQLANMKTEIEEQLKELIAPEKMADVLRTLLHDQKELQLISLKNLPVRAFNGTDEQVMAGEAALFYHGMELVIEGEYFNVLDYVKRLEALKGFEWQTMSYDVLKYPRARVTLSIGTLSLEEDWIGV